MSKKVTITQSNYIPWKGFFDALNTVDEIIIYDVAQFTRRDWRSRNRIKTPHGTSWLTIPVAVKGKYLQTINESKIAQGAWNHAHWKIIKQNYSKAPYFLTYQDFFEPLFLGLDSLYLSEINVFLLKEICKLLHIPTVFKYAQDFQLSDGKTEKLVELCKQTGASDYYTGPSAKNYLDETLFVREGIRVHYFDYSGYPVYHQLYGEFVHEVSIIDLLLNEGPNAPKYMKSFGFNN